MLFKQKFSTLNLLNIIFPSLCSSCECFIDNDKIFCEECSKNIKPIVSYHIKVTKKYSMTVYALSEYKDPLKSLILKKFYSDRFGSVQIAKLICERTCIKNLKFDFIIPIPLHWTRYAKRGFNQSYEIAKQLGEILNIPILNVLKRSKRTNYQSGLDSEKRQENVKEAFSLKNKYRNSLKKLIENKNLLFVDDLFTTGATLKNAVRPLLKFNSTKISAVVGCRVV